MSKKINKKRQAYAQKQEKQGQNVVKWIFIALIILAVIFAVYMTSMYT